ncbi:MAG: hypothetical protein CME06_06235 [Gemmatimonadetes bacterium]|nr:hypothetical protein [Gemmatimonadota bacterium]
MLERRSRLVLLAPALLFLVYLLPLRGGFTDDGFIHIQYARNLIALGEYSFNPGEVSFGTSSPLWVLMLAAIGCFSEGGESLIWISRVLSWLAGFAALAVVFFFAIEAGARRYTAFLATCVFATHVWFARWTALSMESSVAVLAVALVGFASVRAVDDCRDAALMGALIALAGLVRQEVYLALPLIVLIAATGGGVRGRRSAMVALAAAAALLVPWFAFAKLHIGTFLPNTAAAKSVGLALGPAAIAERIGPIAKIVASSEGVPALALAVSLLVLRGRSRILDRRNRFMLLWVVALPAMFIVLGVQVLSRYMLLISPMVAVLGWLAIEELSDRFVAAGSRRALMGCLAAIAIVLSAFFYTLVVLPPSRAFAEDLKGRMKGVALYLDAHAAAEAVVAAADIGYLAFYGKRRVLDLGGLVEPITGELRSQHSYEEIVDRGLYFGLPSYARVDYFIDRDLERDRFEGRILAGHRFEKVFETTVRCLGIRKPGPYHYTLYELSKVD